MSHVRVFLGLVVACFQIVHLEGGHERTYLRLTVILTDSEGDRLVPGLTREDFEVFDQGIPQFIEYFSATPSPNSVIILLDMNGSMQSFDLNTSLKDLIQICNGQSVPDEISLIAFSRHPTVVKSFAWRVKDINFAEVLNLLERRDGYGETGLMKALGMAKERMQTQARNYNRAVILITDAEEDLNYSSFSQIQSQFETMGVRVYGIFFPGEKRLDHGRLHNLATMSGGRYFSISEPSRLDVIVRWFLHELRYQYVIGYTPSLHRSEGKKSSILVKLSKTRQIPGISLRFTTTRTVGRTQKKEPAQ